MTVTIGFVILGILGIVVSAERSGERGLLVHLSFDLPARKLERYNKSAFSF